MKVSTEPALYLFLAVVIWAFLEIFFGMNDFIFPDKTPCKELYMFTFHCDPSNMTTMAMELSIGLIVAIVLAVYFRKKERREKEQRKKEGLKQICDRFIHTLEHVTSVNDKVRQYYRIITSSDTTINYPANVSLSKKQCEDRIQGLRGSAEALENSLVLVAGDLDHSIKSGMRFFVDVVKRDTILFDNQFSDNEKLSGLVGTANATKERLKKYAPDLIENAELELKDLKNKIKQGTNVSKEIMDFVWRE